MEPTPDLQADRVRAHTAPAVLARIDRTTRDALADVLEAGTPDAIRRRLSRLDREWDVDRALLAVFSALGSLSLQLGWRWKRGLLALLQVQVAFLGLHALVGWCPPLPVLRRLGVRTSREIEAERHALLRLLRAIPSTGR